MTVGGTAGLEAAAVPRSESVPDRTPRAARGWSRRALGAQRLVGRLAALVWLPLVVLAMRFVLRWRIRDAGRCRNEYARLLDERRPLLVVANHLTMVDSAVIGWGLGSAMGHVARHRGLPWNVPLQRRV